MADIRKKILLIDDDEIHLTLAESMLSEDFEICTAKSAKDALDLLHKGYVPNLILLDIIMPKVDGWETYRRIKTIGFLEGAPVAFLTSVDSEAEKTRAKDMGAVDYITKPYTREYLLEKVNTILENNCL